MNNTKIIFVFPNAYPCRIGGLEIFNDSLIKKLSENRQCILVTSCESFQSERFKTIYLKRLFLKKLTRSIEIFYHLVRLRDEYDLIYLSFARTSWINLMPYVLIKKLFGKRYMFTIHGGGMQKWKPHWPFQAYFRNASVITGVSEGIVEEYSSRAGRKVIYTPPLINYDILEPSDKIHEKWRVDKEGMVFIYVGSLKELKKVDTVIAAVARLDRDFLRRIKFQMLIVGDGAKRSELELLAKEKNLDSFVRFLGSLSRDEVPEIYSMANLYVISSIFEGQPMSLLEAFANQLPALTSDAPGIRELSENNKNSLMFEATNEEDCANKLKTLLQNDEMRQSIAENGYHFYKRHYSFDSFIEKFENIIQNAR